MNHSLFLSVSFTLCFLLCFFTGCKEQRSVETTQSPPTEVIKEAEPGSVGVNAQILSKMGEAISVNTYPNIHSVLIAKNGKLVYEHYFEGSDELWGDSLGIVQNSKDRLHDVRSISKSIVSACIGIAIDQGKIKDVKQKVFEFFPEHSQYAIGPKAELNLYHLLTMTSGLEWNEELPYSDPENSEIKMTSSPDPMEYVLSRPMDTLPGTIWNYNGGTTQLLAAIIKKTTGLEVDAYAKKYLFDPIGTVKLEWTYFPEIGIPAAASGLRLTSRDLLKFGMLYAQNGKWEGRQLLPKKWVEESMKSYIIFGRNRNVGYGYQFWIFDGVTISENQDHPIVAAVGNGDQRIYWDAINELIVVVTAGNYNNWTIQKDSEALLTDFVYPAIIEKMNNQK